jgi:hypothetical protein
MRRRGEVAEIYGEYKTTWISRWRRGGGEEEKVPRIKVENIMKLEFVLE